MLHHLCTVICPSSEIKLSPLPCARENLCSNFLYLKSMVHMYEGQLAIAPPLAKKQELLLFVILNSTNIEFPAEKARRREDGENLSIKVFCS